MRYYEEVAHIKKSATGDNYLFQSNEEHLEGVAKLAEQFESEFGMGSWGMYSDYCMTRVKNVSHSRTILIKIVELHPRYTLR